MKITPNGLVIDVTEAELEQIVSARDQCDCGLLAAVLTALPEGDARLLQILDRLGASLQELIDQVNCLKLGEPSLFSPKQFAGILCDMFPPTTTRQLRGITNPCTILLTLNGSYVELSELRTGGLHAHR